MREAQLMQAEQGLNGMARKVFAAVPVQEPWTQAQVIAELRRTGHACDATVVGGCLDTLRGRGLVREPSRGMFVRVRARLKPPAPVVEEEIAVPAPVTAREAPAIQAAAVAPLERLAALASALRLQAQTLLDQADRVEEIALDAQQLVDTERAGGEKLRQLQALLKGMV